MQNGGLKSLLDSLMSHLPTLTAESVILVTGNRIRVKPHRQVVYRTAKQAERLEALPANLWVVLSTRHRSHTVANRISMLAKKQGLEAPQYILPSGLLNEVIDFVLQKAGLKEKPLPAEEVKAEKARSTTPKAPQSTKTTSDVVVEPKPASEPRILGLEEAAKLFEKFFTRDEVRHMPNIQLINNFWMVLEIGKFEMWEEDFYQLLRHYRKLANWQPIHCDTSRRRDRTGNLPRLHRRHCPRW